MDPASAIGLISTIANVGEILAKGIKALLALHQQYSNADLTVTLLIGQLSTIKAALDQIERWTRSSLVNEPQHSQLVNDLTAAIGSCQIIVLALNEQIESLSSNSGGLTAKGRATHICKEQSINSFSAILNNQIVALQLLLTAVHCQTDSSRSMLLSNVENRQKIQRAKDDSSSMGQSSTYEASFRTAYSQTEKILGKEDDKFNLESVLLRSAVYQNTSKPFSSDTIADNISQKAGHPESPQLSSPVHECNFTSSNNHGQKKSCVLKSCKAFAHRPSKHTACSFDATRTGPMRDIKVGNIYVPKHIETNRKKVASGFSWPMSLRRTRNLNNDNGPNSPMLLKQETGNLIFPKVKADKILLLGTGCSGKTTLLKALQMRSHEFSHWSPSAYVAAEEMIQSTIEYMYAVLKGGHERGLQFSNPKSLDLVEKLFSTILSEKDFYKEQATLLQKLWEDAALKECCEMLLKESLDTSAPYFFNNIERIGKSTQDKYRNLMQEDILRYRVRTTGIYNMSLSIENCNFTFMDTGGERAERKKWIHAMDCVATVIFVIDCSNYDLTLYEDSTASRYEEDIALSTTIFNSRFLTKASVILMFTKLDILEDKIKTISFKKYVPEFTGNEASIDDVKLYLTEKFTLPAIRDRVEVIFCSFFEGPDPAELVLERLRKTKNIGQST